MVITIRLHLRMEYVLSVMPDNWKAVKYYISQLDPVCWINVNIWEGIVAVFKWLLFIWSDLKMWFLHKFLGIAKWLCYLMMVLLERLYGGVLDNLLPRGVPLKLKHWNYELLKIQCNDNIIWTKFIYSSHLKL